LETVAGTPGSPMLMTWYPESRKRGKRRAAMAVGGVDPGSLLS